MPYYIKIGVCYGDGTWKYFEFHDIPANDYNEIKGLSLMYQALISKDGNVKHSWVDEWYVERDYVYGEEDGYFEKLPSETMTNKNESL